MKRLFALITAFVLTNALFQTICPAQSTFWKQSSGPYGGSVNSTVQMPTGEIFASNDLDVFVSTDNGLVWRVALSSSDILGMWRLSVGDAVFAWGVGGAYRSTDKGKSWQKTGLWNDVDALMATRSGIVLAATSAGVPQLLRSTDDGSSWTTVLYSPSRSPRDLLEGRNGNFYATSVDSLLVSGDRGKTWKHKSWGNPSASIRHLAVDSIGYLYAVGNDSYLSTDDGDTWSNMAGNGLPEAFFANVVAVDRNGSIHMSGGGKLYVSSDHGLNWSLLTEFPSTINSMGFLSGGSILVGTAGNGLYSGQYNSSQWVQIGLPTSSIIQLCSVRGMVIANDRNRLWESTDNGLHWKSKPSYLTGGNASVSMFAVDSNLIFGTQIVWHWHHGGSYGEYYSFRSTNNGPWEAVPSPFIESLTYTPQRYIFIGTDSGVYISKDTGITWSIMNNGLPPDGVSALIADTNGAILVETYSHGIYKSTNNGGDWFWSNFGISDTLIGSCLFTRSLSGQLYFLAKHRNSTLISIYSTTSFGDDWDQLTLSAPPMDNIFVNNVGIIYSFLINDKYPLRSTDNGRSWEQIRSGLANAYINCMVMNSDGHLFIGTAGEGVYVSTESIETNVTIQGENSNLSCMSLEQNYPNPFNPMTRIRFSIPQSGHVSLKVYNLLGQEITQLTNEYRYTGTYSVMFDGSNLPSGIYFYTLACGQLSQTKRLVLLK